MKAIYTVLLALILVLFGTGCIVSQMKWALNDFHHTDPSEKSIILEKSQTRDTWVSDTVTFTEGIYIPELKTENGILYRAPKPVLRRSPGGFTLPQHGGIYIPNQKDKNQNHGVYHLPSNAPHQLGINRLRPNNLEFKYAD